MQPDVDAQLPVALEFGRGGVEREQESQATLELRARFTCEHDLHREQLIVDALITYLETDGEQVMRHQRFLELDGGTLPVEALVDKLHRYQRLRVYTPEPPRGTERIKAWRSWYPAGLPNGVRRLLSGGRRGAGMRCGR